MAGLAFEGVEKRFGELVALRSLTLEVADGELMVLVGPSGSGKTTALRLAAGLEDVTEGRLLIGGRDVTSLPPAKRNVAMVFQSHALFPHLRVRENIGFGLRARGVPREEAQERLARSARLVRVEGLLDRRPGELSGGERQRVALARALAHEPDVFLLDEPLSSLDARLRVDTRAELKRLHRRLGATMLHVTHDQVEAMTLGDRIAVLADGALQQVGTPDEVYGRPANRFVAQFIGSPAMNVWPAVVDGGMLRAGPFLVKLPPGLDAEGPVEVGVRPQHVLVGEGVEAVVDVVEPVGSETFLYLDSGGTPAVVRVGPSVRPAVGDRLRVSLDPERVHVFDAATGEARWP